MKKTFILTLIFLTILSFNISAQQTTITTTTTTTTYPSYGEKFGKTLNLGLGIGGYAGYYGYVGRSMPVLHADYEFDALKNFTLAPFINFYTFKNEYYWGNNDNPYRYYYYRQTVIPIGVKGTYYFNQLLKSRTKMGFLLSRFIRICDSKFIMGKWLLWR